MCATGTHIPCVSAIPLARNVHMCASSTHLPRVRVADSRTCPLFRPTSRPHGTKPAEVRAHLPRSPGISHAHPPASCRFPDPFGLRLAHLPLFPGSRPLFRTEARASARAAGRKWPHVRDWYALPLASGHLLGCKLPHVRGTNAHPLVSDHPRGARRAHVRGLHTRAHARPLLHTRSKWFRNTKQFLVASRVRSVTMPTTSIDGEYPCR
jgi:hypothetical protein